ncbi:DUF3558 domain-containing protein [Amycolatopsis sp. NBC_00345]
MAGPRNRAAAAVAVAAFAAAGCSSATEGAAEPSPVSSSAANSSAAGPAVPNPLDPARYLADPCAAVPPDVLAALRYTTPGEATLAGSPRATAGPGCGWDIGAEGLSVQIIFGTANRDKGIGGIAGIYRAKDSGQYAFAEPAPAVEGYPAVFGDRLDRRAQGNCTLWVGLADDLAFAAASMGYQGNQDSCQVAEKVAAAVVSTLKGA